MLLEPGSGTSCPSELLPQTARQVGGSLLSHQREEGVPILEFLSGISWVSGCAWFRVPFRGQLKLRAQEGFLDDL